MQLFSWLVRVSDGGDQGWVGVIWRVQLVGEMSEIIVRLVSALLPKIYPKLAVSYAIASIILPVLSEAATDLDDVSFVESVWF